MIPPPLPSSTPPPANPADVFVTTTARLSLVMAVLGVLYCLAQLAVVAVIGLADPQDWLSRHALTLPPALQWLLDYGVALCALLLAGAVVFLLVAWGLMRRREWARLGFIAFLVVVGLANFACLPLIEAVFSGFTRMFPAEIFDTDEGRELLSQLQVSRWTTLITAAAGSLAMAALHGWLIIKLQHRDVRVLFRHSDYAR